MWDRSFGRFRAAPLRNLNIFQRRAKHQVFWQLRLWLTEPLNNLTGTVSNIMTIDCKRPNELTCNCCVCPPVYRWSHWPPCKKKMVKEVVIFFRSIFNRSTKGQGLKCSCSIKLDNKNDTKHSKTCSRSADVRVSLHPIIDVAEWTQRQSLDAVACLSSQSCSTSITQLFSYLLDLTSLNLSHFAKYYY